MGSGNLSNSDTSSEEEIDQQPDKVSDDDMDDTTGVGRSYECTFCKRGFTNAQALGGHMNIHRKDKAIAKAKAKSKSKAKQKNHHQYHESSSTLSNKPYTPVSSHDEEQHQYAAAAVGAYTSYQVYYQASNNPRYLHGYHHYDFMASPGAPDQSLSLRIGSTPHHKDEDDDDEERLKKTDIDLELRLGH